MTDEKLVHIINQQRTIEIEAQEQGWFLEVAFGEHAVPSEHDPLGNVAFTLIFLFGTLLL